MPKVTRHKGKPRGRPRDKHNHNPNRPPVSNTGLSSWVRHIADISLNLGEPVEAQILVSKYGSMENCKIQVRAITQAFGSLRAQTRKQVGAGKSNYDKLGLEWGELGGENGYYVRFDTALALVEDIPLVIGKGEQRAETTATTLTPDLPDGERYSQLVERALENLRSITLEELLWCCDYLKEDPPTAFGPLLDQQPFNREWFNTELREAWEARGAQQ